MTQSPTSRRRIAVVAGRWHADVVDQAVEGFRGTLADHGSSDHGSCEVEVYEVPGAFEIPLHAKRLAASGRYAAIAACALVVDGGIYRHDFVASSVVDALMRVQLETDVPIFSAVLTPHLFREHAEHRDYFTKHLSVKGQELARAAISTLAGLDRIPA